MTKVILTQDQSYISVNGSIKFGKKGDTIDSDTKFLTFIKGKFTTVSGKVEDPKKLDKPIEKMNKLELIELLKTTNTDISDEELENMTKAQIIELIQEA